MKFVCSFCILFLLGCQQQFTGTHLRFEMIAPQQTELFIVDNDKSIAYGGGLNAVEGKTTWQGELNLKQKSKYKSILTKTDWLKTPPENDKNVGTGHYNVRLRDNEFDYKFTLSLTDTKATKLYKFLQRVSRERLKRHLDALPRSNVDTIIDRKLKTE